MTRRRIIHLRPAGGERRFNKLNSEFGGLMSKANIGKMVTYVDGEWQEGNPKVLGPRHHAVWLSSVVFDGAWSFEG